MIFVVFATIATWKYNTVDHRNMKTCETGMIVGKYNVYSSLSLCIDDLLIITSNGWLALKEGARGEMKEAVVH